MLDIVAITICVNYSDILQHTLIQNAKFFKHWYIVSSPEDTKTAYLLSTKKEECPNVTLLIFTEFYKNSTFDKGSALKFGQTHVYEKHTNENNAILILDADIYLSNNFQEEIPTQLSINTLYGTRERLDYWSLDDFRNCKNAHKMPKRHKFIGFFQLYSQESKKFYEHYDDCSTCDMVFRDLFEYKIELYICVRHLGQNTVNWKGRDYIYGNFNYKGDIFDKNPNCDEKCERIDCDYKKHTLIGNNGGSYCCGRCKNNKNHGKQCERRR